MSDNFESLSPDGKLLVIHRQILELHTKLSDALARLAQLESKQ